MRVRRKKKQIFIVLFLLSQKIFLHILKSMVVHMFPEGFSWLAIQPYYSYLLKARLCPQNIPG